MDNRPWSALSHQNGHDVREPLTDSLDRKQLQERSMLCKMPLNWHVQLHEAIHSDWDRDRNDSRDLQEAVGTEFGARDRTGEPIHGPTRDSTTRRNTAPDSQARPPQTSSYSDVEN